jgi:AraC-like DNA-binding protein
MFRIENSRTEIQQMKYLREHPELPTDLFKDPESSKAQEVQEIILGQINRSAGKDFFDDLSHRGQDEPAIITHDGYLVNGNRRTAALKQLGERYINCAVLPEDATAKDIYELEQELQLSQDFREPYHWINELRNIRRGIEDTRYQYTEKEMAQRLRMSPGELKSKLKMLDLIDAFLIWKGLDGVYDYEKLDDTEQVFIQLEKASKKYKNDEAKLKELRNAIFHLIEAKPVKGRLYGYVMDLIKNFDQVYQKMLEELNTEPKEKVVAPEKKTENGVGDDIDALLGDIKESSEIFTESTNAEHVASTLVEKIADVKAENKEKDDVEAVYVAVSNALREIQGLVIDSDTAKIESIKNKLQQIIQSSNVLLSQIRDIEG